MLCLVAPYVGAWIETEALHSEYVTLQSLPTWERGLKLHKWGNVSTSKDVAPYVGAWIETPESAPGIIRRIVAPYVGAWIETIEDVFSSL